VEVVYGNQILQRRWHINKGNPNRCRRRKSTRHDRLVETALKPNTKMLSGEDKRLLKQILNEKDIMIASARDLPLEIKKAIVKKAKV